ncbi:hypothetical protein K474DRAFT_1672402 [Panus rudis PR-1116 ss-1]|nr:hypothetical protein K474DRAFT_1672402 [Panus rudis PR-1116 ss-1]
MLSVVEVSSYGRLHYDRDANNVRRRPLQTISACTLDFTRLHKTSSAGRMSKSSSSSRISPLDSARNTRTPTPRPRNSTSDRLAIDNATRVNSDSLSPRDVNLPPSEVEHAYPAGSYRWPSFNRGGQQKIAVMPSLSYTTRRSPSSSIGPVPRVSHSRPIGDQDRPRQELSSPSRDQDVDLEFRRLQIKSHSHSRDPTPPQLDLAAGNRDQSNQTLPDSPTSTSSSKGESGWERYARPDAHSGDYVCLWRDSRGSLCSYAAKKHLVKRHIESKHMQIRPLVCEICGKGFSQKTNYMTHLNVHTGAVPHKCLYCDEAFGDPARRHRHMKSRHGHVASARRGQGESEPSGSGSYYCPSEGEESD